MAGTFKNKIVFITFSGFDKIRQKLIRWIRERDYRVRVMKTYRNCYPQCTAVDIVAVAAAGVNAVPTVRDYFRLYVSFYFLKKEDDTVTLIMH